MRGKGVQWVGFLLGVGLAALWTAPGMAQEKYPNRPISIVVPWPPGGRTDIVARMVAPPLEKILGQPVVVVNRPGASGYLGMKSVSTAKPDGYTLGIAGGGLMALQYTSESKIRREEFKWVGQCYMAPATVSVSAASPWKTIEEFVDYGRKNPMKLKHGNSGPGGTTHLDSEGFAKAANLKFTQVYYKGEGPAVVALGAGEVDASCSTLGGVLPMMEAGKVRVLALQSEKRSPQYPNIPTLRERGINWVAATTEGLIVAKATPDSVVTILESALEKALKDPALVETFKKLNITAEYKDTKEFTSFAEQMDKRYYGLVKDAGLLKQ